MPTTTVLILGATSDIGLALARVYAASGCNLILAARNAERLNADIKDLIIRGGRDARNVEFDILDTDHFQVFIDSLGVLPDVVICVVGLLGDQRKAEANTSEANEIMCTNYLGPALILGKFANIMEQRGSGLIIGISSVAGERGRASNYIYGSAKAGFSAFLSGLRNRLSAKGVHVMTVKPGFVNTRMTTGMKLPKFLTATPQEVAHAILRGSQTKKDIVYIYSIWRWIMLIIRNIPETIFKKLRL